MDDDVELEQSDDQSTDWQAITAAETSTTRTTVTPAASKTSENQVGRRQYSTLSHRLPLTRATGFSRLMSMAPQQQTRSGRTADEAGRMSEQTPIPGIGASNVYAMPESLQDMAEAESKTGMGTNYTATQQAAPRMANKEHIGHGSVRTSESGKYSAERGDQIRRETPAANANVQGAGTAGSYSRRRFHTAAVLV